MQHSMTITHSVRLLSQCWAFHQQLGEITLHMKCLHQIDVISSPPLVLLAFFFLFFLHGQRYLLFLLVHSIAN